MRSPKRGNKIFPSQRNTNQNFGSPDGKFWSPIFLLRIRTKRTRLKPQSMSSGMKPVLKSSFDDFDRSTFSPFDAQRISKSSTNFFADVPSPLSNKLRKGFRTSLDATLPKINTVFTRISAAALI